MIFGGSDRVKKTILGIQIAAQFVLPFYGYLPNLALAAEHDVQPVSPFSADRLPELGGSSLVMKQESNKSSETPQQDGAMQDLSTVGQIVASDNAGNAARNYLTSSAIGLASGNFQNWLQQFGTANVNLNVDDNLKFQESALDLLLPFYDRPDRFAFTQVGVRYDDERWMANWGLGQRHFFDTWMFGYNTFFDRDLSEGHSRFGVGLELWRDFLKLSTNGYYRLSDWKQSTLVDNYESRPANGYDLKMEGYLPSYPQLGMSVGFEKYYGDDVALFGSDNDRQHNPSAVSLGLTYTPIPLVEISATHKDGQSDQSDTEFGIQLNYALGVPFASQVDPDAVALRRSLAGSRYDLVDRNNTIVLDYRNTNGIKLSLPKIVSGPGNSTVSLQATVESANGLDHIVWDDAALRAAGGSITGSGINYSVHLPNYIPDGLNTYYLSGVAYDTEGHTSSGAVSQIQVQPSSVDPDDSEISAAPSTIIADGKATSVITLNLKDANNAPLAGQTAGLSFALTGSAMNVTPARTQTKSSVVTGDKKPVIGSASEVSAGRYQATLTAGNTAGIVIVTPSLNGRPLSSVSVTQTADDSHELISMNIQNNNQIADGAQQNTVQVQVKDPAGNSLAGKQIDLSVTGSAQLETASVITDHNGLATVKIKDAVWENADQIDGSDDDGKVTLTATSRDDATITAQQSVIFKPKYTFSAQSDSATSYYAWDHTTCASNFQGSSCGVVTYALTNNVTGQTESSTPTITTTGGGTVNTVSNSNGKIEINNTKSGTLTVNLAVAGDSIKGKMQSVPVKYVANLGDVLVTAAHSTTHYWKFSGSGFTTNGDPIYLSFDFHDQFGNPASGITVTARTQNDSTPAGSISLDYSSNTTNSSGSVSFSMHLHIVSGGRGDMSEGLVATYTNPEGVVTTTPQATAKWTDNN